MLSIGGNDLRFGDIIADCVQGYLTYYRCGPKWDSAISGQLDQVREDVGATIRAIREVLNAAQGPGSYQFVLQSYPSPMPAAAALAPDARSVVIDGAEMRSHALFDAGEEDGVPFIVMELLEGETLAERDSDRTMEVVERQLERAREHGARILLHGDSMYPSNVWASNNPVPVLYVLGDVKQALDQPFEQ